MTVTQRMFLLVISSILGLAGLAILAYTQIDRVYTAANFNTINTLPSVFVLSDVSSELYKIRLSNWHHLMQSEKKVMEEDEQNIFKYHLNVEKLLKDYEPLIADAEDKALLDNERVSLVKFDKLLHESLELSTANHKLEARDVLQNNQDVVNAVFQDLNKHIEYNSRLGKKSSDEAMEIQGTAVRISIILAIMTMLIVGGIGFIMTRKLLVQLGGEPDFVVTLANKIAQGDLRTEILLKQNDKTSVMAAMKNMILAIQSLVFDTNYLAEEASKGNLDTRSDASKHQGDFRIIIEGVNQTLDTVNQPLSEVRSLLLAMEKGDMTGKINGHYQGQLDELVQAANNTIDKLAVTIEEVINATEELSNASAQISSTSQSLAHSASEQAHSVDETSYASVATSLIFQAHSV